MDKIRKPFLWFDNTFKTRDDLQFIILIAIILFVVFTKCYVLAMPAAKPGPQSNSLIIEKNEELCKTKCGTATCCMREHQAE
jgi:hypothetical protein